MMETEKSLIKRGQEQDGEIKIKIDGREDRLVYRMGETISGVVTVGKEIDFKPNTVKVGIYGLAKFVKRNGK